ncbi:hypothetical protein ACMFMG_010288 [Clarireedia jacksonii]
MESIRSWYFVGTTSSRYITCGSEDVSDVSLKVVKSVFQVASKVYIQSNSFSFSFEYHIKAICITVHRPREGITATTAFRKSEIVAAHKISLRKTSVTTTQEDKDVNEDEPPELLHYVFRALVAGLPYDAARPGVNDCEVVLAFPVDNDDVPVQPTSHDVFAFLPVSTVSLNFLIQADFILQASREEIMFDSTWNRAILEHIADTFCSAILNFCERKRSRLRLQWVKYLPVGRAVRSHPFWKSLSSEIIQQLSTKAILLLYDTSELRTPETLRILPSAYLDKSGSPLFIERPGRHRKYISLEYAPEYIATLKLTFVIPDIEDLAICNRIKQDIDSSYSRMKLWGG